MVGIQATYNSILDANGQALKVIKYATEITAQTLAAQARCSDFPPLPRTTRKSGPGQRHGERCQATEMGNTVVRDVVRTMQTIKDEHDIDPHSGRRVEKTFTANTDRLSLRHTAARITLLPTMRGVQAWM